MYITFDVEDKFVLAEDIFAWIWRTQMDRMAQ